MMRIAELTASAERFAAEFVVGARGQQQTSRTYFMLSGRLLVIARLNVVRGRKPFSRQTWSECSAPAVPTRRVGGRRRRNIAMRGARIVPNVSRLAGSADPRPLAEIIVLRPERAHFADFDTRLARARGPA
jgi:hypothetical protein